MPTRLPTPGPSFLKEEELPLPAVAVPASRSGPPGPVVGSPGGPTAGAPGLALVGMTKPSTTDEGWWLAVLFVHDEAGVLEAEEVAPRAGPPPAPPLAVMGPVFAGALSGLILEDGGRQQLRLALPSAADPAHPWRCPLVLRMAVRWEPMRAATLRPTELAQQALHAFRRALMAAGRP